jgi:hypothetical protein
MARIMEIKAVMFQNENQSQVDGKMFPMVAKPPSDSYALVSGLKKSLNCFR